MPDRGSGWSSGGGGGFTLGGLPARAAVVRGSGGLGDGSGSRGIGPIMTIGGPTVLQARPIVQSRGASRTGQTSSTPVHGTHQSEVSSKETLGNVEMLMFITQRGRMNCSTMHAQNRPFVGQASGMACACAKVMYEHWFPCPCHVHEHTFSD